MHKVKSFARSKAHAHGYNPWSSDAGQLANSTAGTVEPTTSHSPSRTGRNGSVSRPSEPSNLRHATSAPERGRAASQDRNTGGAIKSSRQTEKTAIPTSVSNDNAENDRTVHFVSTETSDNTKNGGEPPDNPQAYEKQSVVTRFLHTCRQIILHSWVNVLLVFVPVGIACELAHIDPTIVFVMNAIAIVPLAGLLSYATESVAHRLGDTIGALLNVTFGNAVELIIFIIALTKDEISIVQASIIGSVLSNLLLILGMSFLLGGLRFREQIYNSTVTQMSACLLSISALSLLLPTAFHASFSNSDMADLATLKISRGTSVILLLVYIMYLLFQLRSHAYLYASIPQEVIDLESHPGILHHLGSSSSSSSSSSSRRSSISSESSGGFARSFRAKIRRMSHHERDEKTSARSSNTSNPSHPSSPVQERRGRPLISERHSDASATEQVGTDPVRTDFAAVETDDSLPAISGPSKAAFLDEKEAADAEAQALADNHPEKAKRTLRTMAPRLFSFQPKPAQVNPNPTPMAIAPGLVTENQHRPAPRRAASLPPRLQDHITPQDMLPYIVPLNVSDESLATVKEKQIISRTSAVILLLCSTALVAVCAEFMVSSIDHLVSTTNISEAFVGLILLPIVGNAAEHVTAVTVAAKNKMDLAIGVAVGSSIQIALFVTPLIVLLGWILDKDMGLYFNIFETVALFTSCFVVNFLVLDGRSNYLEGALLCAAYIIISVAAFFYPNEDGRSSIGSGPN